MGEETTVTQFKEWYDKNSDGWNKQRRNRYATDSEYKATVLERNRKHRSERKKDELKKREGERAKQKVLQRPGWKTFVNVVDGEKVELVTIGAYAQALGVSVQAIRLWERNGVIPPPGTPRASGQQRVYTAEEVERSRGILLSQGRILEHPPVLDKEDRVHPYEREVLYPTGRTRKENMYTIGVLAQAVHLTVVTLSHHERKGYLPRTPFRGSSVRRRLYTKPMIDVVLKAFESRAGGIRGRKAWKEFYAEVLTGWTKIGVVGAKLKQTLKRRKAAVEAPEDVAATS
jgi:DNA-binding transcriptional MerR regulator